MKKINYIFLVFVLFLSVFPLNSFASTNYDHEALMEYEGYGKAMYEAMVRETTFLSGQYTDNKKYVKETIDVYGDYAKSVYDEMNAVGDANSFKELVGAAGGTLLTVADYIKRLFSKKEEEELNREIDYESVYGYCFNYDYDRISFNGNQGCNAIITLPNGNEIIMNRTNNRSISISIENNKFVVYPVSAGYAVFGEVVPSNFEERSQKFNQYKKSFNSILAYVLSLGIKLKVSIDGVEKQPVLFVPKVQETAIKNFINSPDSNDKKVLIPELKASLVCPDKSKVALTVQGSTFLNAKGENLAISKDGTVEIDSMLCNLNWDVPEMDYVNDRPAVKDDDGNWKDIETGKTIYDNKEDCDGVLCFLSKIVGAIVDLAAEIVKGILDGLESVFKFLFVPPDNFWSDNIAELEESLFGDQIEDLLARTEEFKNVGGSNNIASLDIGGVGSAPTSNSFQDVVVSLMGVDDLVIIDSSIINSVLDTIHDWVRGVFYALLVLFNVNQLYKLIRGTSLLTTGRNVSDKKDGA